MKPLTALGAVSLVLILVTGLATVAITAVGLIIYKFVNDIIER